MSNNSVQPRYISNNSIEKQTMYLSNTNIDFKNIPSHIGLIKNTIDRDGLIKRLPFFELSYETISHKKVFPNANLNSISIAIPNGKKYCVWFSFEKTKDVCYLIQFNKNKTINQISIINVDFPTSFSMGTILYGTMYNNMFLIEDIFYYKGIYLKNVILNEKFGCIKKLLLELNMFPQNEKSVYYNDVNRINKINENKIYFALPYMWKIKTNNDEQFYEKIDEIKKKLCYDIHHIQIRSLTEISPYINISLSFPSFSKNKNTNANTNTNTNDFKTDTNNSTYKKCSDDENGSNKRIIYEKTINNTDIDCSNYINIYKPQYKQLTVFNVIADIQYDIYHLFACGKNKNLVYHNIAYIPDIKTSVFMNNIFRNIRENKNLDYIEESDNEDDFENIAEDKYVYLNKSCNIECVFHPKFKKWIPVRLVDDKSKIIHINKL